MQKRGIVTKGERNARKLFVPLEIDQGYKGK
jgi:hypothetical protein